MLQPFGTTILIPNWDLTDEPVIYRTALYEISLSCNIRPAFFVLNASVQESNHDNTKSGQTHYIYVGIICVHKSFIQTIFVHYILHNYL